MLKRVTLALDATDPTTWVHAEVEDLSAYLASRFDRFPDTARIYHEHVADSHDVTPADETGIARLAELPGPFYVVVFPGAFLAPFAGQIIFSVFLFVAAAMLAPSAPPAPTQRNQSPPSPNNELAERVNRARLNGRIPDIFGTVRATPDLIAPPYKIFENNSEVEYSYMCIGRGWYDIDDVRDGDTLCVNIPGTTVQIYEPFTSPNSGDAPQLAIGTPRTIPVLRTKRSNSVSGQVLRPPNETVFEGAGDVRFSSPNTIELPAGSPRDFTTFFVSGDVIEVTGATITAGVPIAETLQCLATAVELRLTYANNRYTYVWDTEGGSLLFRQGDDTTLAIGLFAPGSTVVLTQTQGSSRFPGADLSGTYVVESAEVNELTTLEQSYRISQFLVVKLVDPASVNPDWDVIHTGSPAWDWLTQAGEFIFDISHPGADVDYSIDLNGTYDVVSVTQRMIVLNNPAAVNAQWNDIATEAGGATPFITADIASNGEGRWIGPYVMTDLEAEQLFCNFVAQNGLYKDDGTAQIAAKILVEVEVTPVDEDDVPFGDPELFQIELIGSDELKETVAVTLTARFSAFYGRCSVRARRVTEHDEAYEGQVVDEVRWRDLYSCAFIDLTNFGNVTTVQTVTYATASALAVKERKLNMEARRRLPVYGSDGIFDDENLVATENAADILVAICRDRYIGNRQLAELDVANFYATIEAVQDYFGHEYAGKFSYTFDQDTVSFEETVGIVAQANFCIAYRRGNVIRLSFEQRTDDSTLLFNHRNKVPGTERRTVSFGYSNDNDGIEYVYVNPEDDSIISVFLPVGYAAINPKRIESIGVRNHLQAYFHAWRAWNKLQFQYLAVEFEATSESELLLKNDRILVADNTRPGTQDGEVLAVDTLELTLSQPVDLTEFGTYVIHLQHVDGTVESIGITAGTDPNQVVLDEAPAMPLATDPEGTVRTGYVIVGDEDPRATAFLVSERETLSRMTSRVQAVNYDERYYANDPDFINNVIGANGYGPSGGYHPAPNEPPYTSPLGSSGPPSFKFTAGADGAYNGYRVFPALGTLLENDTAYTFAEVKSHNSYGDLTIVSGGLYEALTVNPLVRIRILGHELDATLYGYDLDPGTGNGTLFFLSVGFFPEGEAYALWTESVGGTLPDGVLTFTTANASSVSGGTSPSGAGGGFYSIGDMEGTLRGYSAVLLVMTADAPDLLKLRLVVPTVELLADPQNDYWSSMTIPGQSSEHFPGAATFSQNANMPSAGFTELVWEWEDSELWALFNNSGAYGHSSSVIFAL
jgi:hypothetical protein